MLASVRHTVQVTDSRFSPSAHVLSRPTTLTFALPLAIDRSRSLFRPLDAPSRPQTLEPCSAGSFISPSRSSWIMANVCFEIVVVDEQGTEDNSPFPKIAWCKCFSSYRKLDEGMNESNAGLSGTVMSSEPIHVVPRRKLTGKYAPQFGNPSVR